MYQNYQKDQTDKITDLESIIIPKQKVSLQKHKNQTLDFCNQQFSLPRMLSKQIWSREQKRSLNQNQEQSLNSIKRLLVHSKIQSQYLSVKLARKSNRYQSLNIQQLSSEQKRNQYHQKDRKLWRQKRKSRIVSYLQSYNHISTNKSLSNRSIKIDKKLKACDLLKTETEKIDHQFNHSRKDLQGMKIDEIMRLNFRINKWISKIDNLLNDHIKKQAKNQQKIYVNKNNDQIVNFLERCKNKNEEIMDRIIKEHSRLLGKQGQLKEEEYQILLQKQKHRIDHLIKDEFKNIKMFRKQIDIKGAKINGFSSNFLINKLKILQQQFVKMRRLQDSNNILLNKLYENCIGFKTKNLKIQQQIGCLLTMVEQKKINLRYDLVQKYNQLNMKKLAIQKNVNKLMQMKQREAQTKKKQNIILGFQLLKYQQYYQNTVLKIKNIRDDLNQLQSRKKKTKSQQIVTPKQHTYHTALVNKSLIEMQQNQNQFLTLDPQMEYFQIDQHKQINKDKNRQKNRLVIKTNDSQQNLQEKTIIKIKIKKLEKQKNVKKVLQNE